jgi:hypothetical protein
MPTPIAITDITEQAYENLTSPLTDKPKIKALLKTWTDMLQLIQDDLYLLMTETLYKNAEGVNLDRYGEILGISRSPTTGDELYKSQIVGEILKRSSDGSPDRIREIMEATSRLTNTKYFEHVSTDQQLIGNMGAIMIYGEPTQSNMPIEVFGLEGTYLRQASPVTTGSCVYGYANDPERLWVAAELASIISPLYVQDGITTDDFLVTDNADKVSYRGSQADFYEDGWERGIVSEIVSSGGEDGLQVEPNEADDEDFQVQTFEEPEFFNVIAGLTGSQPDGRGKGLEIVQHNQGEPY